MPVNLIPDIVSNTVILGTIPLWMWADDKSSGMLPVMWLFSPIVGPVMGVADAWNGYPFWDPVALDEHRKY